MAFNYFTTFTAGAKLYVYFKSTTDSACSSSTFGLLLNDYCILCSGTEKQHVADDYAKRLHIGQVECEVSVLYMYVYILVDIEIRMESAFSWHEFYKDLIHTNWYIYCMLKLKLHAY